MTRAYMRTLSLVGEPAVLVKGSKITFANASACRIIGENYALLSPEQVFGEEIIDCEGSLFIAARDICGSSCILRSCRSEAGRVIFFSPAELAPLTLNAAFTYALRSQLSDISLCLEAMKTSSGTKSVEASAHMVAAGIRSQNRMMRILNNAALIHSAVTDAMPFHPAPMDLSGYCDRLIAALEGFFPNVTFEKDYQPQVMGWVDSELIEQLLLNLISNSLTHGRDVTEIIISLAADDEISIAVSDNGRGISQEQLPTVFDRYRHGEREGYGVGVGLGLTVARAVASAHNGALILESSPEQGTTVRAVIDNHTSEMLLKSEEESRLPEGKTILTALSGCLDEKFYSP